MMPRRRSSLAPSRWQRWWAPVTGLAAAAAVIIGVVIVLPDSGSDDSLQFAAAEVETTIQASRNDGADMGGSADAADGADEELTTTTAAASEELAPSVAAEDSTDGTLESRVRLLPRPSPTFPRSTSTNSVSHTAEGEDEFEDELNKSSSGAGAGDNLRGRRLPRWDRGRYERGRSHGRRNGDDRRCRRHRGLGDPTNRRALPRRSRRGHVRGTRLHPSLSHRAFD